MALRILYLQVDVVIIDHARPATHTPPTHNSHTPYTHCALEGRAPERLGLVLGAATVAALPLNAAISRWLRRCLRREKSRME